MAIRYYLGALGVNGCSDCMLYHTTPYILHRYRANRWTERRPGEAQQGVASSEGGSRKAAIFALPINRSPGRGPPPRASNDEDAPEAAVDQTATQRRLWAGLDPARAIPELRIPAGFQAPWPG